jgi:glutamine amidotransferase
MTVAIIDYGLGNLYSILQVCAAVGIDAVVTSDKNTILTSQGVILPGVGAFKEAMNELQGKELIDTIHNYIKLAKPFLGICLGMQLLFEESYEFGYHKGLAILKGSVNPMCHHDQGKKLLKVPHIGWNNICCSVGIARWEETVLDCIREGEKMYFLHSYIVNPADNSMWLAQTKYEDLVFCSAVKSGKIYAVQFHPEKSGPSGIQIFDNFKKIIQKG